MTTISRRTTLHALIALCAASAQPASAQVDLLGPGAGFVSVGAARIESAELDDWLDARDYPTFGQNAISVGLGGYRILSSGVMLGAEAQGFIIGDAPYADGDMGLGGGYATLAVGYAFEPTPRIRLYPRVGAGPGGMALWFASEDSVDFEDVLAGPTPAPEREPNLSRDGLVLDLGAGAEFLPAGRHGLLIGLRAGWLTGPFTSTWENYENTVRGGPDASISGPYARVTVGWAWRR